MKLIIIPAGTAFGNLAVTRQGPTIKGRVHWHCLCNCGNEVLVNGASLRLGKSKSCGCITRTHGGASGRRRPEYRAWCSLRARCYHPSNKNFANYGGRGIKVCERWRESYVNFLEDMGRKPSSGHSLDRIDNSKGYSPENCRWATSSEQGNNRRTNCVLTFSGRTQSATQWAREYELQATCLFNRLALGWTVERAITQPVRRKRTAGRAA